MIFSAPPHEEWRCEICEWSYPIVDDHFRIEREEAGAPPLTNQQFKIVADRITIFRYYPYCERTRSLSTRAFGLSNECQLLLPCPASEIA